MAWLIVSLAAVSNATIDLGRAGMFATETLDDDGEVLWFEDMSSLKPESLSPGT
jgi:hypothetical protein